MAATLPKGIGTDAEVNQANQFMREQDWDQAFLKQAGQDPNNVHLNDDQEAQLLTLAREKGIGISDAFEIDSSGNIRPKGHVGRDILIAAGVGVGIVFAGPAIAGMFASGATDAGATAAAASAAEGGADAAGIASAATAGGVEAGATSGLAAGVTLPGAGTALDAAGAVLPSTTIGTGMATLPAGAATSMPGTSTLGTIGNALKTGSKVGDLLGAAGAGVGAATTAAGNNALDQEKLALDANAQNTSGQSAFVNEELGLAREEDAQRKSALQDAYRASYAANPRVSPFDPAGAPKLSSSYMNILNAMNDQASKKLTTPATYDTSTMPKPTPYTPIDIKNVQGATNTAPSTLQKIGQWVGSGLTIGSKIAGLF